MDTVDTVGIAVPRRFQDGLERCGFECAELLLEQTSLSAEDAAQLVYVHTKDASEVLKVANIISVFKAVERTGATLDEFLEAAAFFGALPRDEADDVRPH